ncbi:glutathione-disulfide reductase [uncultured Amaricoccus sp.]|uniref:glutathione-disulfide reductase n=1 Tax=uncultured Amaricoccus sp. TaxID=339341 RepID=UPI002610A843|nr:glutathione-disulfide reductase [uncultured Amaricoccus sp.]
MPDSAFDFDLFVIGGGSGGVRAARIAAEHGARVGLAEEFRYGGTCVIRGCIPKKLLVYAAGFADHFEDARGYGWTVEGVRFDWPALVAAKDAEIARLEAAYADRLRQAGVQLCASRASLLDAHRVRLANGAEYRASHILVATGGSPFVPAIPGAELGITSNEIFDLPVRPDRLLIVGGGYVACEFAGIMNGLGTHVTQLYRGEQILRGFDEDLRDELAGAMRARGVALEVQRDVVAVEKAADGLLVTADNGETHLVDQVLFATGRRPNTAGLGLEPLGVELQANGAVRVDAWSQTAVPSIFAVGDVTDRVALTPVAIDEGQAFADTVFGGAARRTDHSLVPKAVFTQPPSATLGLTEAEARQKGPVEIYRTRFRPLLNTLSGRQERTMMKLVVGAKDRRVLGVHLVGEGAAEMVQLAAIAVGMGATKDDFDRTMALHPTSAEELVIMRTPVA